MKLLKAWRVRKILAQAREQRRQRQVLSIFDDLTQDHAHAH